MEFGGLRCRVSDEKAHVMILSLNTNEGSHYRVVDITAEKINQALNKTHASDLYQYPAKGDIITMIDEVEIANIQSGEIIQLLNSANTMGIITHTTCR